MPPGPRRRFWLAVGCVLLLDLAALLSQWPFLPGTFGNVDASAKVWQVESLLAGQEHLTYPAQSLDSSLRYIPDWYVVRVDGRPCAKVGRRYRRNERLELVE